MYPSDSFGNCSDIEAGSLVEWSFLGNTGVGLLLSAGNMERGGRKVAMAKVKKLKSSEIIEICCLVLRKHKKHTIKTS
jgi:hypothetical protein|tara:strand:- start:89 stop:322 length:234 start_codon:yes stop_codon:yes gene_type:complete